MCQDLEGKAEGVSLKSGGREKAGVVPKKRGGLWKKTSEWEGFLEGGAFQLDWEGGKGC